MYVTPASFDSFGRELTDDGAERLSRNWTTVLLSGLLLILVGLLIFSINWSVRGLATFIGALFIVEGCWAMLTTGTDNRAYDVVTGLLSMAAGIAIIVWPSPSLTVLGIFLGAWLIVIGTTRSTPSTAQTARPTGLAPRVTPPPRGAGSIGFFNRGPGKPHRAERGQRTALLQHEKKRAEARQNRTADKITAFSGSMAFVYLHIVWFASWIGFGVESYPYRLLTGNGMRRSVMASTLRAGAERGSAAWVSPETMMEGQPSR